MDSLPNHSQCKSAERVAFELWLRTGMRLSPAQFEALTEHKFNPYHDQRDGRFTFAPGGPALPPRVHRASAAPASRAQRHRSDRTTDAPVIARTESRQSHDATVTARDDPKPRLIPA